MFTLSRFSIVGFSFIITCAATGEAQSQSQTQELTIQLSTIAPSFPVGSRIDMNLDVTNLSDQEIVIPTHKDIPEQGGFDFIISPSGAPLNSQLQMTKYMWMVRGATDPAQAIADPDEEVLFLGPQKGRTLLRPHETVRFSAVLNDLYPIVRPGVYTIFVRKQPILRDGTITPTIVSAETKTTPIESNTVTVTITEPPPPTIALTLTTNSQAFPAGQNIDADLAVTNISNLPIQLPLNPAHPSAEDSGFKLSGTVVRTSSHSTIRSLFQGFWKPFSYQYPTQQTVEPNQTIHYPVRISALLDVSAYGSYTVVANKADPVTHAGVQSNALTIAVQ